MDAKGRVAIPAKQREVLLSKFDGQMIATIDTQTQCLLIYPLPFWERLEQRIGELPSMNTASRQFQRLVIGYASDLELDSNGRVLLPASLREYAKLEKKLVLVGQVDKLELWAESLWFEHRDKSLEMAVDEEAMPEEMLSLRL
tara:strand:+ start:2769 stop:3197 length:429 start_codon:yes stop_codon:yes gene_type:complete